MAKYIKLEDLMQFPIRLDHYDKEHGDINFVYGIETVLEYAENLPVTENDVTMQECKLGVKKTNADHIRSMSDEELAKYLFESGYDEGWPSAKHTLEWLQQPVEVSE